MTIPGNPAPEPTSATAPRAGRKGARAAELTMCRLHSRGSSRGPITPRETRRAREGESEDLADLVRRLLHFNWHGKIVTTHQMSILLRNLADARILTSTLHVSL